MAPAPGSESPGGTTGGGSGGSGGGGGLPVTGPQTAVIGGVYQNDSTDTEQGVPYLREIPILGWLFKNKATTKSKNELLVFLTPRILNAEATAKDNTL